MILPITLTIDHVMKFNLNQIGISTTTRNSYYITSRRTLSENSDTTDFLWFLDRIVFYWFPVASPWNNSFKLVVNRPKNARRISLPLAENCLLRQVDFSAFINENKWFSKMFFSYLYFWKMIFITFCKNNIIIIIKPFFKSFCKIRILKINHLKI